MMDEIEYDYYTTLATLYDTQDIRQPYLQDTMPSSKAQRVGAVAESRFITECLERNFEPHTPTTPMPWDYIVHCPAGDLKVQVKSSTCKIGSCYSVNTGCGRTTKEHIPNIVDIVAIYLAPIEEWWMIPQSKITCVTLRLNPDHTSKSKYKKYQNNWSVYYE
jgi:hypothetical protein